MNVNQAIAEVLTITARPDRQAEILSAINWAISHVTIKGNWSRDLIETSITIDPTLYGDTIQLNNVTPTALVSNFRKIKYLKPYGVKKYLSPIGSDKIFTPGQSMQKDCFYMAGDNLTYILSSLAPSLELGYYQYAPILDTTVVTTHWMLDVIPWTIIDLASARIFRSIGDDESQRQYQGMGEELLREARRDMEDQILAQAR